MLQSLALGKPSSNVELPQERVCIEDELGLEGKLAR